MHGSIREREKIMIGIKVDDMPIIPMNQIYYSFVRPHMDSMELHQLIWQELGLMDRISCWNF
jgi:hypothetical protein